MTRSNRPEVRNPTLRLPAMAKLQALPPEVRALVREALLELRVESRAAGEQLWRKNKPPMAAYWRAVSTWAGHFARGLR